MLANTKQPSAARPGSHGYLRLHMEVVNGAPFLACLCPCRPCRAVPMGPGKCRLINRNVFRFNNPLPAALFGCAAAACVCARASVRRFTHANWPITSHGSCVHAPPNTHTHNDMHAYAS